MKLANSFRLAVCISVAASVSVLAAPCLQILYGDIGFEMSRQARQLPQDLPGRGIPPVDSFHFAFGVDHFLGHAAGTMKVEIRIEVFFIELLIAATSCSIRTS